MSKARAKTKLGELRIIGGTCRSRKILFPEEVGLRPTPNRIRETLFNWLSPYIQDAFCLDLFAGSGALSFEALSRGAKYCLLFDSSDLVIQYLNENKIKLSFRNIDIIKATFPYPQNYLRDKFDLVFLDPPFESDYIATALKWLQDSDCLHDNAIVYVESDSHQDSLTGMTDWKILKDKVTGNVRYSLITLSVPCE